MNESFKMALVVACAVLSGIAWERVTGAGDPESAEANQVWALEQAIYERRAQGDTLFYSDISSERYMGWPAPAEKPVPYADLREFAKTGEFRPGEVIDVVSDGIAVDGDTAISFFSTHRTVRPGGQAVDERYENIHVFVKREGGWRLFGAMSRRVLDSELRAAPLGSADAE